MLVHFQQSSTKNMKIKYLFKYSLTNYIPVWKKTESNHWSTAYLNWVFLSDQMLRTTSHSLWKIFSDKFNKRANQSWKYYLFPMPTNSAFFHLKYYSTSFKTPLKIISNSPKPSLRKLLPSFIFNPHTSQKHSILIFMIWQIRSFTPSTTHLTNRLISTICDTFTHAKSIVTLKLSLD